MDEGAFRWKVVVEEIGQMLASRVLSSILDQLFENTCASDR
jgi:hypothetical protein